MATITVFMPVYNRAHIITKLYESLCDQTDIDFERLIIDDGSSDNIEETITEFKRQMNAFEIRFYRKPNGGKHTCINMGTDLAQGDWFFIVDSDDHIAADAIATIKHWVTGTDRKSNVIGVAGQRCYASRDTAVGSTFGQDNPNIKYYDGEQYIECTSLERKSNNIIGDKAEILLTDVIKRYKFPVFEGEKFLTENCIWYPIAADGYKIRWFNKPIYFCEYLEGGLTKTKGGRSDHFYGDVYTVALYVKHKIFAGKSKIGAYGRLYKQYVLRGRVDSDWRFVQTNCRISKFKFFICGLLVKTRDEILRRKSKHS